MLVKGLNGVSLELAHHRVVMTELREYDVLCFFELTISICCLFLHQHRSSQKSHSLGLVIVLLLAFHNLVKDFIASSSV